MGICGLPCWHTALPPLPPLPPLRCRPTCLETGSFIWELYSTRRKHRQQTLQQDKHKACNIARERSRKRDGVSASIRAILLSPTRWWRLNRRQARCFIFVCHVTWAGAACWGRPLQRAAVAHACGSRMPPLSLTRVALGCRRCSQRSSWF